MSVATSGLSGWSSRPRFGHLRDRRSVAADADGDRPALLVDLLEEQAVLAGLHDELVLARQQVLGVGAAARGVEEGLGRLEQQRDGLRGVADLAVRQAAQVLGRKLDADLEPSMSDSIIEAMAARSWPRWWVTMVLMTGYCSSASCMSMTMSTFSS